MNTLYEMTNYNKKIKLKIMHNLKYVYITEDGNEHETHYTEDRCEGKYYPNEECLNLKNRFYKAYYERKRKE